MGLPRQVGRCRVVACLVVLCPVALYPAGCPLVECPLVDCPLVDCLPVGCLPVGRWLPVGRCPVLLPRLSRPVEERLPRGAGCLRRVVPHLWAVLPVEVRPVVVFPLVGPLPWRVAPVGSRRLPPGLPVGAAVVAVGADLPRTPVASSSPTAEPVVRTFAGPMRSARVR